MTGIAVAVAVVLVLAVVFSPGKVGDGTYDVTANFARADGLRVGAPVRAAGVRVGEVAALDLGRDFRVEAVLRLDSSVALDTDATAAIVTDGIFGDKLVRVDIGGGSERIPPGGTITYTEDSLVLDDLLELIVKRARANRPASDGGTNDGGEGQ